MSPIKDKICPQCGNKKVGIWTEGSPLFGTQSISFNCEQCGYQETFVVRWVPVGDANKYEQL